MTKKMFYGATPNTFEKANWLRKNCTLHEKLLWNYLRKRRILGVRIKRQHPIGTYVADFYCHAAKLVIEIDGPSHAATLQRAYDKERTLNFSMDGLKVIRFSNEEIENELEKVVKEIESHICQRIHTV